MEERILTIVNPISANGKTGKRWPGFEQEFIQAGLKLDICLTSSPMEAMEIAAAGLKQGYRRIMAVGGDGTLNEVINGLLREWDSARADFRLIVFSQGTGSDFIKGLGISRDIREVIALIKKNRVRCIDLGLVTYVTHEGEEEERYFVNVADLGIGGATTHLVNRSSKILGGFLTYLFGILRTLISYQNKVIKLTIDDEVYPERRINSVMIANGEYFGGGIRIAPGSDLADGSFNLVILGDLNKLEIVTNLARAYRGTHLLHPKVEMISGERLKAESTEKVLVELDGETVGRLPASFRIIKHKLPVLIK